MNTLLVTPEKPTVWETAAFFKLAALGAIVLLPTKDDKYLLQVTGDGSEDTARGKLRPPGGHYEATDGNLWNTIVREIGEEFGIAEDVVKKNLEFKGYEYRPDFFGNAVYELRNHDLKPGHYQASNHKDEKIDLVEASLSDKRYVGPDPELLLSGQEKADEDAAANTDKAACYSNLFKSASATDVTKAFTPDFTPEELADRHVHARLYHKLMPRVAGMAEWPAEWKPKEESNWLDWYAQYHAGRRSDDDAKQIQRWLNFKARHGAAYTAKPSPRRAWTLTNWAVDPARLLPADQQQKAKDDMQAYADKIDARYHDLHEREAARAGVLKAAAGEPLQHLPGNKAPNETKVPKGICPVVLAMGVKVEKEHTTNIPMARGIAVDHIKEDPQYYDHLKVMEDKYQGKEKEATYSPPLDAKVLKAKYPHLLKDPVHLWRAENGVELVHQEPDVKELNRIMENWRLMSSDQKAVSESKSRELFGVGNEEHYNQLLPLYDSKEAKAEQGVMSGNTSDSGVPAFLAMPPSCEEEAVPGTAGTMAPVDAHEHSRQECIKQTGNPDPDPQFLSDWLHGKPLPEGASEYPQKPAENQEVAPGYRFVTYDELKAFGKQIDASDNSLTALPFASTAPVKHADAGAAVQEPVPAPPKRLAALPLAVTTQPVKPQLPPGYYATGAPSKSGATAAYPANDIQPGSSSAAGVVGPVIGKSPVNNTVPQPGIPVEAKKATSVPTVPESVPTTGPEAIYHALRNLNLADKEAEAKDVIRRKLRSKRPAAVETLGFIDGLRKSGIAPHELMINAVPVIPTQFRPFSVAGDTFVPGDANELYRDLINLTGTHAELEQRLGVAGAMPNRLHVYDAVKALYGYGEPTSPKTRERGVAGFLKKVVGIGPKHSFVQSKMLSKNVDYVGRSVIGVDPDLTLDEIGIPKDMAWKLYAPYVQRRLVRSGMEPADAVRYVADRHEQAEKMLQLEVKERPVVYSRSPAWHKFNIISGWPSLIEGNMIRVNPLVSTGLNCDYDGDAVSIHTPSLPESVDDAKNKLMPSKMLFSIKDRDKVMPVAKHEQILGLRQAQLRPAKAIHNFPDEQTALAAINRGDVRMSDEVVIGKGKV